MAQKETREAKSRLAQAASEYSETLNHTRVTLEAQLDERYETLRKSKATSEDLEKVKSELRNSQEAVTKLKEKNKELRCTMHNLKEEQKAQETSTQYEVESLSTKLAQANAESNAWE